MAVPPMLGVSEAGGYVFYSGPRELFEQHEKSCDQHVPSLAASGLGVRGACGWSRSIRLQPPASKHLGSPLAAARKGDLAAPWADINTTIAWHSFIGSKCICYAGAARPRVRRTRLRRWSGLSFADIAMPSPCLGTKGNRIPA